MPYQIEGLDNALRALRKISPDLYKEMNKEIEPTLIHMRDQARSFLPEHISGLSNWSDRENKKSRTSRTRAFPQYDSSIARKGIAYSRAKQKATSNGWVGMYALLNKSAAGAIVETAGRLSGFSPSKRSESNNKTNNHFSTAIDSNVGQMIQYGTGQKTKGRIIFRAAYEDNGKAKAAIAHAVETTLAKLQGQMGIKA